MTPLADLPAWAAVAVGILVLLGTAITALGSVGLLRFATFYERVHAPTLGTTAGTGLVLAASMVFFTALGARPVIHEILIAAFITVTTPVTLILLVRATLFRDRFESDNGVRSPRLANEAEENVSSAEAGDDVLPPRA
ncbi:monovalent cation/H(+) antiporter subunit G [Pseudoxanthobacter sp. M-2]|uniref:monovalent cation/H(+) antiporter subunit G n=1 Tax=Pseudoxanthobacter sp. M-2 TaxID=3078754 RepID=UPI0038FC5C9D